MRFAITAVSEPEAQKIVSVLSEMFPGCAFTVEERCSEIPVLGKSVGFDEKTLSSRETIRAAARACVETLRRYGTSASRVKITIDGDCDVERGAF